MSQGVVIALCHPKTACLRLGFEYLQDWDLGDLVDVIVDEIGLAMQARIITVREVFKQNNHTVEIELGDKKLTQLKKARLIY